MQLKDYFQQPDAMSVTELRRAIGASDDSQVRQWVHGYANRQPGPLYCVAIEKATRGQVTRSDLRNDWQEIWPELAKKRASAKRRDASLKTKDNA